jgi:PHD/YefM family antitoxin component YafN of YafNO toxin-antitoxin module
MVITQHGEAKAVLQDISSYEQTQESLALLRSLPTIISHFAVVVGCSSALAGWSGS